MTDTGPFWEQVAEHLSSGYRVFIAMVAENTKSSPGTPGAKLLVSENGIQAGTIGGGIMEYKIEEKARAAFDNGRFTPEFEQLQHKKSGQGIKSGLICSGSQTNVYFLCRPDQDLRAIRQMVDLKKQDMPGTLIIGPEGLRVDAEEDDAQSPRITLMHEPKKWAYREYLLNHKRIAIIGGGHCARALSQTMYGLGYEVFIFDTRENVFTLTDNRFARRIHIVKDYSEAAGLLKHPEQTWAIVMTSDYASDVRGLLGLSKLPIRFVGIMGTHTKIANIFKELRKSGISQEWIDSIHAPVGLPIESDTPEEIAISIAAQILQIRNKESNS